MLLKLTLMTFLGFASFQAGELLAQGVQTSRTNPGNQQDQAPEGQIESSQPKRRPFSTKKRTLIAENRTNFDKTSC